MKILRMTSDFCVNLAACAVLGLKWCDSRITYIIVDVVSAAIVSHRDRRQSQHDSLDGA